MDDPPAQLRRAGEQETGCSDQERFLLELEFVQCLANPHYLNWLAQHQYFDDPAFINYLGYLQYWKRPVYASRIIYPHCLFFLDMLQSKEFRSAIARTDITHYHANRLKAAQPTAAAPD